MAVNLIPDHNDYPFNLPSYISALDDGNLCRSELKDESTSWRSERYPAQSKVLLLDHNQGKGRHSLCNDEELDQKLREPQPQIRFILLLPTVHEKIAKKVLAKESAAKVLRKNELFDLEEEGNELQEFYAAADEKDLLNISKDSLLKVLTRYDIAPAACTHIRGQEQIFGSRQTRDENANILTFEFWYAIRARMYVASEDKTADLKLTIVTRYDVVAKKSLIILKYRAFNDLSEKLKAELVEKMKEFVGHESTQYLAENPYALGLLHFNSTVQWYRRAARDPRDTVRDEEEKAHEIKSIKEINLRRLHLTIRSLEQDKVQLDFILGVIDRLRQQHDLFQRIVCKKEKKEDRDWLYLRVEEDLARIVNQITYFKSSIEDVKVRAERLMDLLFKLSAQQNAIWNMKLGKQAMHESASMKAIAVVSMLFLPGTFVAGILGSNVFAMGQSNPGSNNQDTPSQPPIMVSSQWWILPLVSGVLTILTFTIWYWWKTWTERGINKRMEDEEVGRIA